MDALFVKIIKNLKNEKDDHRRELEDEQGHKRDI
jgi:hypothetical protein